jgi:hypothetical protein
LYPDLWKKKLESGENEKQLGFPANGARHGRVSVLAALFRQFSPVIFFDQ